MNLLSWQVKLLHLQQPGTNSGLRTLLHTMQVRAPSSLMTEQTGQDPSMIDDPSTTRRLPSSFLLAEFSPCARLFFFEASPLGLEEDAGATSCSSSEGFLDDDDL
jgi:hypothetical protein